MNNQIRNALFTAMFAALIIVGTYLKIPVGPVPIVLANFFVLLAGLVMGWKSGLASVGLYLLLGLLGLPVFTGGGGIGVLLGPTGGFLFGYLVAVFIAGTGSGFGRPTAVKDAVSASVASIALYAVGVPWLKLVTGMDWKRAVMVGMAPFLLGDGLKVAAAVIIAAMVRKSMPDLFPRFSSDSHTRPGGS